MALSIPASARLKAESERLDFSVVRACMDILNRNGVAMMSMATMTMVATARIIPRSWSLLRIACIVISVLPLSLTWSA